MEFQNCLNLERRTEEKLADTLAIQYNFDDTHIAVACSDGMVRIYASNTGRNIRNLNCRISGESHSVTSIRWRPSNGKTQNVLFATTDNGCISHWHATSGKILDTFQLDNTQVLCSDITQTGEAFALGCNDMSIKVYDESTKALINTFTPGRGNRLGHSNRIFAVKWNDENCLVSGGWDNNVIFWDNRNGKSIGGVFGPHICGESIDFHGNTLFTGSYDFKDQLQLWDIRNFELINTQNIIEDNEPCKIYSIQIQKNAEKNYIVMGCKGNSQLLCYNLNNLTKVGMINDSASIYSIDFSQNTNKFAAVSTDHYVGIYDIQIPELP